MPIAAELWRAYITDSPLGVKRKTVTNLAPGGPGTITVTVPGHEVWHPLGLRVTYTTSATVGTRTPILQLQFGDGVGWRFPPPGTFDAGVTMAVRWWAGWSVGQIADAIATPGGAVYGAITDLLLEPGNLIQFVLSNPQAGDTATRFDIVTEFMFVDTAEDRPPDVDVANLADLEHAAELAHMPALR